MDRWKTYLCLCSFCVETTNQTIICKGNHPKLAEPWNGWILKMKPDATNVYKPAILKSCHVGYIKFQSTLPPHHQQFIRHIAKPPMRVVGEWCSDNFHSRRSPIIQSSPFLGILITANLMRKYMVSWNSIINTKHVSTGGKNMDMTKTSKQSTHVEFPPCLSAARP